VARPLVDWPAVQAYYDQGHGRDACIRRFGFSPAAWYKAIRRQAVRARLQRKSIDWPAVQAFYDAGHTYRECQARFRFATMSWTKAVRRGALKARARRWPIAKILAESRNRSSIKRRLLEAGILENRCDDCGIAEWRGRRLSIQLDHRNGVRDDHRLENLRMLCPNCHSQTETFAARNRKKKSTVHNW
jgi:hypothetical protein